LAILYFYNDFKSVKFENLDLTEIPEIGLFYPY